MTHLRNITYVTKPYLPKLTSIIWPLINIWISKKITNNGPYHALLEKKLCEYLDVPFVTVFCNATTALQCAFKALELKGEVITPSFSFVATTSSLKWVGLKAKFVDIEKESPNISINSIENSINQDTSAIVPVHCYGIPCDCKEIEVLANKYDLKVIYDASHAFGIKENNKSILLEGDLSVISFHATKIFNTFEGGAIVCKTLEMKKKLDLLKNFGISDEYNIKEVGINGKMNEFQAIVGLSMLQEIDYILDARKKIYFLYESRIKSIFGVEAFNRDRISKDNYCYYPVIIQATYGLSRDKLACILEDQGIKFRKYFYPPIHYHSPYADELERTTCSLEETNNLSDKILCLPIYPGLKAKTVRKICDIIDKHQNNELKHKL